MLKQTVQYKDFNGDMVQEDFYFNFSLMEMMEQVEIHRVGDRLELLTGTKDGAAAYLLFKQIVLDAYGVKSQNGKNFDKSPEIRHQFETSAAISPYIMSLLQDPELGAAFIRGVLPEEMLAEATQMVAAKQAEEAASRPGVQPIASPLRPVPQSTHQGIVRLDEETTAAADVRVDGAQPKDAGVIMSTAEKRQYTQEELDAIQGTPDTVPIHPSNVEETYTDDQILAMDPQELMRKGLIMRAYALKSQQS